MDSAISAYKYEDLLGIRICPTVSYNRPFHIAFLLDTSGSMEGKRLETVKTTLRLFLDHMRAEDRATLVSYNSDATLLCSAESDVGILRRHVDDLVAGGGTNMEAALCTLAEAKTDPMAVFFLTDGEVNQGILTTEGLRSIVQNTMGCQGIPVYTVGYGADHNAALLQALALTTRASYTYADKAETIPSVVGGLLAALRDEIARNVHVEWEEGMCWEWGAKDHEYFVGSIVANKPQWIVLQGGTNVRVIWPEGSVPIQATEENLEVLVHWFRARSARLLSEPNVFTIVKLQALEDEIQASPVATRPLVLRILAEIAEQKAALERPFQHRENHRGISAATAFANQRDVDFFASPTQRYVSQSMVDHFQATQSEDPQ